MNNEFDEMDIFQTVARIRVIAEEIKTLDIIDPTSRTMNLLAELLWRVKKLEIEPFDLSTVYGGEA